MDKATGLIFLCLFGLAFSQTTRRVPYANYCNPTNKDIFTFALIGGPTPAEGRLEVYKNGQWGTVCNDNFNAQAARAVCRSLGFSGGYEMTCFDESLILPDDDQKFIWFSNVSCTYQWWFQQCSFIKRGQHDCDHSQDVFIRCNPSYGCQERPEITACEASHKSKTLKNTKLKRLSDFSNTNDFYNIHLKPLLRERVVGTNGHKIARDHIVNTMQNLGWSVELNQFDDNTPIGRKTFTNIIATRNPNAPRRLVLACHYDSKLFTQFTFIGMTDSAVPCAMLLDIGTTLNKALWEPRDTKGSAVSLQFIFFDGEEAFVSWTATDSIYGARHLAAKWENEKSQISREIPPVTTLQRIDAFVLLDLIGAANPTFKNWFESTSHLFERLKKTEGRMKKQDLLNVKGYSSSSVFFTGGDMHNFGIEDDHVPFRDRGVPILHLISYPFPSVWHKSSDNESNYDPQSTDDLLKILRVFVAEYLHINP